MPTVHPVVVQAPLDVAAEERADLTKQLPGFTAAAAARLQVLVLVAVQAEGEARVVVRLPVAAQRGVSARAAELVVVVVVAAVGVCPHRCAVGGAGMHGR